MGNEALEPKGRFLTEEDLKSAEAVRCVLRNRRANCPLVVVEEVDLVRVPLDERGGIFG